jgi:hypothetical protein
VVHSSTTPEEILAALPADFEGHVTFDVRESFQVCIIHHWKYISREMIYNKVGVTLKLPASPIGASPL